MLKQVCNLEQQVEARQRSVRESEPTIDSILPHSFRSCSLAAFTTVLEAFKGGPPKAHEVRMLAGKRQLAVLLLFTCSCGLRRCSLQRV